MKSHTVRSALPVLAALTFALIGVSCGGSEEAVDTAASETTTTAVEAPTTTAEPTTTAPTTEATTTMVEETTTTTEPPPVVPDPPPAGTGVLTVDGEDFPFTINTCVTEATPSGIGDSIILLEMRGSILVEGQNAEARLLRLGPGSNPAAANDSFGWGYATDPDDFETLVSESSIFGLSEHIVVAQTDAGLTLYGPPTPFERSQGISVVDDVDPGTGTIIATC